MMELTIDDLIVRYEILYNKIFSELEKTIITEVYKEGLLDGKAQGKDELLKFLDS